MAGVMKPDIMIYDEPTTGQDPLRTRDIDDMIQQTQERFDITSIVISHDMASTFRIGHLITMLYQSTNDPACATDEHESFLRIAKAGDADAAVANMMEHLLRVESTLHLSSEGPRAALDLVKALLT